MSQLDEVLARIDAELEPALERLFAFLRIKSISTDPAYAADCKAAAEWHGGRSGEHRLRRRVRPTPGHPMVVAHDRSAKGPSALFYGHYDVQPVDPLELWDHDPFAPFIETRADGTQGDPGARRLGRQGPDHDLRRGLPGLEGRHRRAADPDDHPDRGRGGIGRREPAAVPQGACRRAASADIGLICDTNMWDPRTPAIQTMLRGLCGEELIITAADRDLHSGFYGSAAANPNHVLARILADLRDADGRITVPHFYDGVPELPEALRAQWDSLDFDPAAFLGAVGLSVPAGEKGRSVLEMTWSRPTCEINGMGGGYQGEGFKTVIPSQASAKVSFRLVFDQDPHAIRKNFREFVRAAPAGRLQGRVHRARRRAAPSASRSTPRPSPRPARRSPPNGAGRRCSSAAAARSRSPTS